MPARELPALENRYNAKIDNVLDNCKILCIFARFFARGIPVEAQYIKFNY